MFRGVLLLALPALAVAQSPDPVTGVAFDPKTGQGSAPAAILTTVAGNGPYTFVAQSWFGYEHEVLVTPKTGTPYKSTLKRRSGTTYTYAINATTAAGGATFSGYSGPPTATGTTYAVGDTFPSPDIPGATETVLSVNFLNGGWSLSAGKGGSIWSRP